MTEFQLKTFDKITYLHKELDKCFDPSTFTLNKRGAQLMQELAEVQKKCDHNWRDNTCTICGAVKEDK